MDNQPLISIIVPVYNSAEFLDECIESIAGQTYKNLEIILVDDGSTDESGKLCDEWKEKDSRIVVLHKENGGISDARNRGMALAHGDYIGFIDSDDVIDDNMYEVLLNMCLENNVAMSSIRLDTFGRYRRMPKDTEKFEIMSAHKMEQIIVWPWLYPDLYATSGANHRLYRKDIVEGITFPVGMVYEDAIFSTKTIQRAGKLAYYNKSLYHYRVREGSTTGKDGFYNEKWLTDKYILELEQIACLKEYGYEDAATMMRFRATMDLYRMRYFTDDPEKIKEIDGKIKHIGLTVFEVLKNIPGLSWKIKTAIKTVFMKPYMKRKISQYKKEKAQLKQQ